jgi:methionyl-tRNA formyltransferase
MRVIFMGSGDIGLPSLRALLARVGCEVVAVVTQPDRPAGRGRKLRAAEVKVVAAAAGIPVLQPEKLRAPAAVEDLRQLDPDVIVVMAYGQILSRAVLDLPRVACLNLHASLLPRHRGAAPIQAAIVSGEHATGITVMYMAEGLDTGDILLSHSLPIFDSDTGGSLHDRLAELAPAALEEALDRLAAGTAPRFPQEEPLATYAGRLQREDGRIDWSQSASVVERHIRAMNPWPAAFTTVPLVGGDAARLKIFSAAVEEATVSASPGEVIAAGTSGLLVTAGDRVLRLLEVQGEGTRRMPANDWQRGHAVAIGGLCE